MPTRIAEFVIIMISITINVIIIASSSIDILEPGMPLVVGSADGMVLLVVAVVVLVLEWQPVLPPPPAAAACNQLI
jgi:hypothetical protein